MPSMTILARSRKLIANNGAVVWSMVQDSFGRAVVSSNSVITNNLRFSSQYYDEESGLHYNTMRYYDPLLSRYISADPIEEEGGWNLYRFAKNDPVMFFDYMGLKVYKVHVGLRIGLGLIFYVHTYIEVNGIGYGIDPNSINRDEHSYYGNPELYFLIKNEIKTPKCLTEDEFDSLVKKEINDSINRGDGFITSGMCFGWASRIISRASIRANVLAVQKSNQCEKKQDYYWDLSSIDIGNCCKCKMK